MLPRAGLLLVSLVTLFMACRKKTDEPVPEPPVVLEPIPPSFIPDCGVLPPEPKPFGWQDSTADEEKNIQAYTFNPQNPDQIIYMTAGSITGFSPFYNLDVVSGAKRFLGNGGFFLPSINKMGWIVFSTIDNNIIKIKVNGDSLSQLTTDFKSLAPQWDYQGKGFYYFKEANQNVGSQLVKVNQEGNMVVVMFPADIPQFAAFHQSDQLIYCQTTGSLATLVQRNTATQVERPLISGPFNAKTGKVHFNNLCVDLTDEFCFWSNDAGIFRCHLPSLKTDTLYKNCDNRIFNWPQINLATGELCFTLHIKKVIGHSVLFNEYKSIRADKTGGNAREIRIFP